VFRGIAALVFFERMHDRHFRAIFSEDMNAAAVTSSQLGAVLSRTQVSCGTFDRTIPKQNHTYWQDTVRAGGGEALAPAGHFHGAVMNNTSEVVANLVRYCDEVMSRRTQALEAAPAP
jgi:hypothetical protein